MGDCPPPEPLGQNGVGQTLANYVSSFTVLARQILSVGYLDACQIDEFTDQLLALKDTLPNILQFDETWLRVNQPVPGWPMDMRAASIHAGIHNYILLLNRHRIMNDADQLSTSAAAQHPSLMGRRRVLESCRAVLQAFEFVHTRVRAGLVCWTLGQQAFNAATLLVLSMLETGETADLGAVERAYRAFLDMQRLGIHRLAEAAVDRLGILMKEVPPGQSTKERVMGQSGMILLEDPGLQGFLDGAFAPLTFQTTDDVPPTDRPRKRRTAPTTRERENLDAKPMLSPRHSKSTNPQRKAHVGHGTKPRTNSASKQPLPRSSRPSLPRRPSGLPSPSMTEPADPLRMPPDVTQWPLDPTSLSASSITAQPDQITPPIISPTQHIFQDYPTNAFDTQAQMTAHSQHYPSSGPQNTFSEPNSGIVHHQAGSDPNIQPIAYDTQLTPTNLTPTDVASTDIVNGSFRATPRLEFSPYGQYQQPIMHQQTALHTPPFSASFTSGGIPCSYPGNF